MRLAADENFNNNIVRGVVRRQPGVDIIRIQDVGLSGADNRPPIAGHVMRSANCGKSIRKRSTHHAPEGVQVVRVQIVRLEEACLQVGRDPATLRRLVLSGPRLDGGLTSVEAFRDTVGRYAEIGITDFVVHWPRLDEPYAADLAVFERIFAG